MIRYRVRCLSALDPHELRTRYAHIPSEYRLHPPERATPIRMASELLLRELLTEQTGGTFDGFRFFRTESGKPYAERSPEFNLSHSGEWILCAVGDTPLGADIEAARNVSPALMRRVCTAAELAFIDGDPNRFLQLWTAKEAYLKYRGTGIVGDLRRVETVRDGEIAIPSVKLLRENTDAYTLTIACAYKDERL